MKTNRIVSILLFGLSLISIASASPLPTGWNSTDLGQGLMGEDSYDGGIWTITSYGYNRHFVYKHLEGDWQITARVLLSFPGSYAELAVTSDLNSSYTSRVYLYQTDLLLLEDFSGYSVGFVGIWSNTSYSLESDGTPCWIRLERRGDILTGYVKSDSGQFNPRFPSWTILGSDVIPRDADIYVGLSVYNEGSLTDSMTVQFDEVTIGSSDQPSGNDWMISGNDMYSIPTGNVGIGTTNPIKKLHVSGGDILLDNNQYLSFINGSGYINKTLNMDDNDDLFLLNFSGGGIVFCTTETPGQATSRVAITNSGNVGIGTLSPQGMLDVDGSIYQRGRQLYADYVFETDYKLESIDEHSQFMWQNGHLKAIPKVQFDGNGREIVEVGANQRGIIEELEKAHIYIEQLNKRIKVLEEKLATLEVEHRTK
jgi:hypothetical protein